ncbi:DUF3889 domain-containing protein [Oceanobacillus longus]|uniref:DUF3889 domain-containing protein n=1 Tax=Oceanobacillus longus TaxID=930120 RepID=A0ABV8H295_9BACI
MYPNYRYHPQHYYPAPPSVHPDYNYNNGYPPYPYDRQQSIRGQATWTDGGQVTKCEIPWSEDEFMTTAVGDTSPYQCGDTLKIRNVSAPVGREIIVKVVDQVEGYPPNKINLHRRAFQALGVSPNVGVINIEIIPSPELELEKWGKYLLAVTQTAYPEYDITDYRSSGKSVLSSTQTKESYDFILQSHQETIKVQGNVIYNPNTDRIISFDIKELN